jgi:hypothetical protein
MNANSDPTYKSNFAEAVRISRWFHARPLACKLHDLATKEKVMAFFKLKSPVPAEQAKVGAAILKVSQSVFQYGPTSEWAKFDKDTRAWLDTYYTYTGSADGKIPKEIDIIPVYDTPTKMHVRIPYHGELENGVVPPTDTYASYPVFLAKYFMRHCR